MAKPMPLCVLLIALLLPLTTTDVSTVPPPSAGETTPQHRPTKPEATAHALNKTYTAEALKILSTTAATPTSETQTTANVEASTKYATKGVQTSPVYSTSVFQNAVTPPPAITSSQTAISSTILSTSSMPTENATTAVVPKAKLSAPTETEPSVQNATHLGGTTEQGKTTTVKLSATTLPVTTKTAQTATKIYPPDVYDATTASKDGKKAVKHGRIVAGLIGGALILMMVGFLAILYKRHKLKKHQIATTDWAGPTPFLETGGGGGGGKSHVTLRSASRISLTSFLPQRLSKRLSLLAETAEEMQDMQEMATGTTFAAKEEKNGATPDQTFDKSEKENNSESSDKTEEVVLVDEMKENKDETSKERQTGQATMKDGEQLENGATQPPPKEDPATEPVAGS